MNMIVARSPDARSNRDFVRRRVVVASSVALLLAGCGRAAPDLSVVRGQILLGGKPLPHVSVTFRPIGETQGNGALGGTDAEGRFVLFDVRGAEGARPGQYRVHLYPMPKVGSDGTPSQVAVSGGNIPAIYINPNSSPVVADVPAEGANIRFELTPDGKNVNVVSEPLNDEST